MSAQTASGTTLRILVIDDEPFVQAITIHQLQQLGYQHIAKASNGAEALSVMQNSTEVFDLIVCDLSMPVMDGFDFMRAAQRANYKGAIVIVSSEARAQLAAAVELASACGLRILGALGKPLEREALQTMLQKYFGLPA